MAGPGVQVGSGYIRVIAKTLPQDYEDFKRRWQQGMEQHLTNLHLNGPIFSHQTATQQGNQMGQQMGQALGTQMSQTAQNQISTAAPQVTAPISQQGPSVGQTLGAGIVAGVIAAGTGKLIADGLSNAMELESSTNKLQASMGLSDEQAAKWGKEIGSIYGANFGGSLEEVEGAVGAVLGSIEGIDQQGGDAVSSLTKKVLTMSDVFGIEASRSAQVLGQMIKTGMVKDAEEGADLLTRTFQTVPANVREDVLDAIDEYGPFMQALGYEGEAAFNLLANSADKGMYGIDKTGDALKEFSILSVDMSEDRIKAYGTLGLSWRDMTKSFLNGGEDGKKGLQTVVSKLLAIKDPALQASTALKLFGTPLEDMNLSEVPEFLKGLQNTTDALGETKGAAQEATDAFGKGMASSLEGVSRSFHLALGEIALPLLTAALPLVQSLAKFMTDNKDAIVAIGGPLLVVGGIIATVVAGIAAVQTVMAILTPVIAALTVATWNWNAALFANPLALWTIAISAVILGAILLWQNWDAVVSFMTDSINFIMDLLNQLGSLFSDMFSNFGDFFSGNWGGLLEIQGGMMGMGMPQFANGGLVTKPTVGLIGEAGQSEIIMNEGAYNANSQAQTDLINQVINNGGTSGGNTQINQFPNADPREMEAILTGRWKQQNGF